MMAGGNENDCLLVLRDKLRHQIQKRRNFIRSPDRKESKLQVDAEQDDTGIGKRSTFRFSDSFASVSNRTI
jgi:hypothetical protein